MRHGWAKCGDGGSGDQGLRGSGGLTQGILGENRISVLSMLERAVIIESLALKPLELQHIASCQAAQSSRDDRPSTLNVR